MIQYDYYGNPYDDGEEDPTDPNNWQGIAAGLAEQQNNQFLAPQMPGQNFSTSKWNFGAPLPVGQNVANQTLTGGKNLLNMFGSMPLNYITSVLTGASTLDYDQLAGGGVGGGGAITPVPTPYLDSADTDPQLQNIKKAVMQGQSPSQIMLGLAATNETDEAVMNAYSQAANEMWKERSAVEAQKMAPAPQTPLQEWLAEAGLPDPRELYTGENLPGDVDLSGIRDPNKLNPLINAAATRAKRLRDDSGFDQPAAGQPSVYGPPSLVDGEWMTPGAVGEVKPDAMGRFLASAGQNPVSALEESFETLSPAGRRVEARRRGLDLQPGYDPETNPTAKFHGDDDDEGNWLTIAHEARGRQPVQQGGRPLPFALAGSKEFNKGIKRTNVRAKQADYQEQLAKNLQQRQANSGQGFRELAARDLAYKGRTPAKQRIQDQVAMMRMLGMSV